MAVMLVVKYAGKAFHTRSRVLTEEQSLEIEPQVQKDLTN
jgi:hypothetical protein